nr:hypothetical protein CFP56_70531 [Quercus suber]
MFVCDAQRIGFKSCDWLNGRPAGRAGDGRGQQKIISGFQTDFSTSRIDRSYNVEYNAFHYCPPRFAMLCYKHRLLFSSLTVPRPALPHHMHWCAAARRSRLTGARKCMMHGMDAAHSDRHACSSSGQSMAFHCREVKIEIHSQRPHGARRQRMRSRQNWRASHRPRSAGTVGSIHRKSLRMPDMDGRVDDK